MAGGGLLDCMVYVWYMHARLLGAWRHWPATRNCPLHAKFMGSTPLVNSVFAVVRLCTDLEVLTSPNYRRSAHAVPVPLGTRRRAHWDDAIAVPAKTAHTAHRQC